MKKYAILSAIYDVDIYTHTVHEFEEKGYITWETRLVKLQPGDVVYIYYSKLPLETEGRILFRTEVLESNLKMVRDEIYGNKDMTEVKAIKLTKVEAIAYADVDKYSMSVLKNDFEIFTMRGGIYLNIKQKKLIDSIEGEGEERSDVEKTLDFFNMRLKTYNDTTFCSCGRNHSTFIKADGTKYYEKHHLIPYSVCCTKLGLPDWEDNKFQLCSNCHREIHYGHMDRKRALIRKIYCSKKEWFDERFRQYAGTMNVLDWIYKLYRVEKVK